MRRRRRRRRSNEYVCVEVREREGRVRTTE
jgi:hypothetical protein